MLAHEVGTAASSEGVSLRVGEPFLPDGGASHHIRLRDAER